MAKKNLLVILLAAIAGLPQAVLAANLNLKLPYPAGRSMSVSAAYYSPNNPNYSSNHNYKEGNFALDFTDNGCKIFEVPVLAVADGKLDLLQYRAEKIQCRVHDNFYDNSCYGNNLIIDHGEGIKSRYAHLDRFSEEILNKSNRGQNKIDIHQGEILGYIGNTGNVVGAECPQYKGTHLHFEMTKNGAPYKPEPISGKTGIKVGNWPVSDNQIYVYAPPAAAPQNSNFLIDQLNNIYKQINKIKDNIKLKKEFEEKKIFSTKSITINPSVAYCNNVTAGISYDSALWDTAAHQPQNYYGVMTDFTRNYANKELQSFNCQMFQYKGPRGVIYDYGRGIYKTENRLLGGKTFVRRGGASDRAGMKVFYFTLEERDPYCADKQCVTEKDSFCGGSGQKGCVASCPYSFVFGAISTAKDYEKCLVEVEKLLASLKITNAAAGKNKISAPEVKNTARDLANSNAVNNTPAYGGAGIIANGRQAIKQNTTEIFKFNSNPADAKVYIDGVLMGTTPFTARGITAGKHDIVFQKTGYRDCLKKVTVINGSESGCDLEKLPNTVVPVPLVQNVANIPVVQPAPTVVTARPPELTIVSPPNMQSYADSKITIYGVSSNATRVAVRVNWGEWQVANGTDSWKVQVVLDKQGENEIHVQALNSAGSEFQQARIIYYSPVKPKVSREPNLSLGLEYPTKAKRGDWIDIAIGVKNSGGPAENLDIYVDDRFLFEKKVYENEKNNLGEYKKDWWYQQGSDIIFHKTKLLAENETARATIQLKLNSCDEYLAFYTANFKSYRYPSGADKVWINISPDYLDESGQSCVISRSYIAPNINSGIIE